MRGTIAFERLTCANNAKYVRILLNDAVYRKLSLFLLHCPASDKTNSCALL